jgi:hypothetical protein
VNGNTNVQLDGNCGFGVQLTSPTQDGIDAQSSFFGLTGLVASDDVNILDTAGSATYSTNPASFDWFGFDSFYRGWHLGTLALTDPGFSGPDTCVAGDTCSIYDLRYQPLDTTLKNYHGTFTPDAACPADVDGSVAANILTDYQGNQYLKHAFEIVGDGYGDEDGLCESNETCVYAPNSGAYQGEGDPGTVAACHFTDGTIENVRMRAYPD